MTKARIAELEAEVARLTKALVRERYNAIEKINLNIDRHRAAEARVKELESRLEFYRNEWSFKPFFLK